MELGPAVSRGLTGTGKLPKSHGHMSCQNDSLLFSNVPCGNMEKLENKMAVTLWPEAQVATVEI